MSKIGILIAFVMCSSLLGAQSDTILKPVGFRIVSIKSVALAKGDRIEEVELVVKGASFELAHVPIDWNFDIEAPISGVATLKASAAHGVGMPFTFSGFQQFITLALYDYGEFNMPLSVTGTVTIYNDGKERTLTLKPENIALELPNQSKDPTP
jgi:hypothetical protein